MTPNFKELREELEKLFNDPEWGAWTPRASELRERAQGRLLEDSDTILAALEIAERGQLAEAVANSCKIDDDGLGYRKFQFDEVALDAWRKSKEGK